MTHLDQIPKSVLVEEIVGHDHYRVELVCSRWAAYVCAFGFIAGDFPSAVLLVPVLGHFVAWTAVSLARYRRVQRHRRELAERNLGRLGGFASDLVRTKEAS